MVRVKNAHCKKIIIHLNEEEEKKEKERTDAYVSCT